MMLITSKIPYKVYFEKFLKELNLLYANKIKIAQFLPIEKQIEIYFKQIELKRYDDYLIVDDAKALMNYIMSCHGNQKEYLGYRLKEFQAHLEKIIDENNGIKITKDCGLFICRK